ncbi:hypothetical protein H4R99_005907 [Coemansia sp. RSA 1722]|nr:hypothetical protein IWW45_008480 [Coemansia sp. RSA 485]KAJ2594106.1 hypothetical protein H4R99_005907 [Coemansia sp. RSA 1722]
MHSGSAFRAVSRAATAGRMRTSVAPMIDVTDPCFLRLLRLISPFGNHQLWTEMVHANAFSRGQMHLDQIKLAHHIPIHELEDFAHGTVVQIGASDPNDAYAAVSELRQMGVRHVNLNCGCPSRNVQMGSFGAVLMTRPELAAQIVKSMLVAATESPTENSPPAHISVKCRIGIDEDESPEFLRLFIDSIINATDSVAAASSAPVSFVLHARRAWLSGLSPEQNRSVPLLNHARAYEMARDYPHTQFVVNGGADSIQAVHDHLQNVDGVMIGRKIRENPWFLSELDQHVYGEPAQNIPLITDVLDEYLRFADHMHSEYAMRYTRLARPLYALFAGRKGKAFRRHLGQALVQARSERGCSNGDADAGADTGSGAESGYRVRFSEVVAEAAHNAEQEHAQNAAAAAAASSARVVTSTDVASTAEQQQAA